VIRDYLIGCLEEEGTFALAKGRRTSFAYMRARTLSDDAYPAALKYDV